MNTVRYDYSPNITIIFDNIVASCPEHGPFMVNAIEHLHGEPCPKCPPQPRTVKYI